MKKLILKCGLSPGDIVMLTAAVRDLHRCYPGHFATDVRTSCPELWENNPYLTALSEHDPEVTQLDCAYPLINQCNETPYHCLHGFIQFLNHQLKLAIKPTAFKGDIHLSEQEKAWYSQVHELTGAETPFWLIAAGGKYDVTIKWWSSERYQEVVNHFRGRIQFVQVGEYGHHHPKLAGTIDLRGQTTLRELIRLVYHSQGVLCSVTALMHLAAAVETKPGCLPHRPCVVVAGGREPVHWEAYPHHQFLHTNGALACCADGGCWRDRIEPLRDGTHRDRPENVCSQVVNGLPRCMDLITAAEVSRRIELYFAGGALAYLSARQRSAAEKGIQRTVKNRYDRQPLNLHSAGRACERFIQTMPACPPHFSGRGIVICDGGGGNFAHSWNCIQQLRRLGCHLPIQWWHLGKPKDKVPPQAQLVSLGVTCIDARRWRRKAPARTLGQWQLRPYALLHSPFREVLLLAPETIPVFNPEFLFETPEFQEAGAILWAAPLEDQERKAVAVWRSCGLRRSQKAAFEVGQLLADKQRCWRTLCLWLWFNENSDFYYRHLPEGKETFSLAFRKLQGPGWFAEPSVRSDSSGRRVCLFNGRRVFKWPGQGMGAVPLTPAPTTPQATRGHDQAKFIAVPRLARFNTDR